MIKLKTLITEAKATIWDSFTLSDRDPWEYYCDKSTKIWYTRKKGTSTWLDMKTHLSAANYKQAMDIITKGPIYSTSNKNKVNNDKSSTNSKTNKDTKISTNDTETKDIKVKTNDLTADYKIQTDIVATLYDMITKNPAKYFKKFKTLINDDETAASMFFQKAQTQFETELNNIKNKDNEDIALNTKLIKNIMNDIYKSIKNNFRIKKSIQLTDPTYKSSGDNIKTRIYSAEMHWQYFNN